METGHVVRFASQKHPFLVEAAPCLDPDCSCSIVTLKLLEVLPPGSAPRDRLIFSLRVCLRTWVEHNPPPRSLEVELLVREFLARFPRHRIAELADEFERARSIERRLRSISLPGPRDRLVAYSDVIDERGGVREGVTEYCFFFVFEGREFLVEDHYCANPECDCRQVHLEFWERVHEFRPKHRIHLRQRLTASFTLAGEWVETRFSEESASTTKYLLQAWILRCRPCFDECRRRYERIKEVGRRSFPPSPKPSVPVIMPEATPPLERTTRIDSKQRIRRNDPCPCGSGLKFKRCCARRAGAGD